MAAQENIFLQSGWTAQDEARLLTDVLGLEPIPDTSGAGPDEFWPARSGPGPSTAYWDSWSSRSPRRAGPGAGRRPGDRHLPIEIDIWLWTGRGGATAGGAVGVRPAGRDAPGRADAALPRTRPAGRGLPSGPGRARVPRRYDDGRTGRRAVARMGGGLTIRRSETT